MRNYTITIKRRKNVNVAAIALITLSLVGAFGYVGTFYPYSHISIYVQCLFLVFFVSYVVKMYARLSIPKIMIALALFMIISSIFLNFQRAYNYLFLILTCTFILSVKLNIRELDIIFKWIYAIGILYGFTIIWQWLLPGTYYPVLKIVTTEALYNQALNNYANDNAYTGFACESVWACLCTSTSIAINFAYIFFKKKENNVFRRICMIGIMYFAILLTDRRSFILMIPVLMFGIGVFLLLKSKRAFFKVAAGGLSIFVLFLLYFFLFDVISDVLTGGGSGIQLSKREVYWELALRMFSNHPLIGNGLGSYDVLYRDMSGRILSFAGAHNCYLQMLAEFGVIGTSLFIAVIINMLIKTIRMTTICVKERDETIGFYISTALFIQAVFILLALSESPFFLPQALIMYFVFINIVQNCEQLLLSDAGVI